MAGSKKSRRKGKKKGKKGRKKSTVQLIPLPLHSLTEIYTKLENLARHLLDCRVLARKKRIEARMIQEEDFNAKRDDAVFKEHIANMLDDVLADLKDVSSRLTSEKDAIQKEVDRIIAEYQKRLQSTLGRIEIEERKLEELQTSLKEYEHLKKMVHDLEEKLKIMREEYERIKVEIMIKTTHLRNQYLVLRAELYNYLRQQLETLIAKVREFILPIAYDMMSNEQSRNRCHRWSFKQEDITNNKLLEIRENYLRRLENLEWEKKYYGTEWVFSSLNEMKHQRAIEKTRWKKRLQEIYRMRSLYQPSKKKAVVQVEKSQLKIVADFQIFLQKKLTAITEARIRKERNDKMKALKAKRQSVSRNKLKLGDQHMKATHTKERRESRLLSISETSSFSSRSSIGRRWGHRESDFEHDDEDLEDHPELIQGHSKQGLSGKSSTNTGDKLSQGRTTSASIMKVILSAAQGLSIIEE